ncbi:MAG: hypothetical protein R3D33_07400 [Hyphomicrobiaceae bacterium]
MSFGRAALAAIIAWIGLAAGLGPVERAHADEWVELGQTKPSFGIDKDTVTLARPMAIDSLRFETPVKGIRILAVTVHFRDGTSYTLTPSELARAADSRGEIDLPDIRREVTALDLQQQRTAVTIGFSPKVTVYGRKFEERRASRRPAASPGPDWDELASDTVDPDRRSSDVFRVGRDQGRYGAIAISVGGRPVNVRSIRIVYGNGETEDVKIDDVIAEGRPSDPIEIEGRRRAIRQIEIVYGDQRRRGPPVELTIWGSKAPAAPVEPFGRDWQELGQETVDTGRNGAVIDAGGRRDGRFAQIGLSVYGGDIDLKSIRVTYANGDREEIEINQQIRDGGKTDPIDVSGRRRAIQSVELSYYRDRRRGRRVDVTLWGNAAPPPPVEPFGRDWQELGQQTVDTGRDRDVIEVGRREGRFSALGLSVYGGDIDLRSMRVVYADGDTEDLDVAQQIRDGGKTEEIDLTGRRRAIREVQLSYSKDRRRGRRVEVTLWGNPAPAEPVAPQGEGWENLGSGTIDSGRDRDTVKVGRREGQFDALALSVYGRAVKIRSVRVFYTDGDSEDIDFQRDVADGGTTEPVELSGGRRTIDRIELAYSQDRRRGPRPEVTVWGLKSPPLPTVPYRSGDWDLLGVESVDGRRDRDIVRVGAAEGFYASIGLSVRGAGIRIDSVKVTYANGETEELDVRSQLRDGEFSRPVRVNGDRRRIQQIELRYSSDRRGRRPEVAVWGEKAPPTPASPYGGGWMLLGFQSVDQGNDRDVFEVGADKGAMTDIGLSVIGNPVSIQRLTVTYGNGERDDLDIRSRVGESRAAKPVSLNGPRRFIKSIDIVYSSDRRREDRAWVAIWGKKATGAETGGGSASPFGRNWDELGRGAFRQTDNQLSIRVDRGDGPYTAIGIESDRRDIVITSVRIFFQNGRDVTINNGRPIVFRSGDTAGPFDLPGASRQIRRVDITFEKFRPGGRDPQITVWARQGR